MPARQIAYARFANLFQHKYRFTFINQQKHNVPVFVRFTPIITFAFALQLSNNFDLFLRRPCLFPGGEGYMKFIIYIIIEIPIFYVNVSTDFARVVTVLFLTTVE